MAVCVKLVIIIILYKKAVIVPSLMNYTENTSYSTHLIYNFSVQQQTHSQRVEHRIVAVLL